MLLKYQFQFLAGATPDKLSDNEKRIAHNFSTFYGKTILS